LLVSQNSPQHYKNIYSKRITGIPPSLVPLRLFGLIKIIQF